MIRILSTLAALLLFFGCSATVISSWPTPEAHAMYHAGVNALLAEKYSCLQDSLNLLCTTEAKSMGADTMLEGGGEWELSLSLRFQVFQAEDKTVSWSLVPTVRGSTLLVSQRTLETNQFPVTRREYQRMLGKINLAVTHSRLRGQ